MNRRKLVAGLGAGLITPSVFGSVSVATELQAAARDAWLYVLPLIEMASLRGQPIREFGGAAPVNVFRHRRSLAGPTRRAVTTPNDDTLYSTAFVDATQGPLRLEIPDCGKRYLSVQIMDMYTNNSFILGPRTPGGAAGSWRLIPPDTKPRNGRDLQLATPHAWLQARLLVHGPDDLEAAHAIQDDMKLHGSSGLPQVRHATPASDWPTYFDAADRLLASDPPRFRKGLDAFDLVRNAGASAFARDRYTPEAAEAIESGVAEARTIVRSMRDRDNFIGGWTYPRAELGDYGDDFIFRALVAVAGLGALIPAEAMYMRSEGDSRGLFRGDGLYRLNLPRPIPVDAFWSLTMYEATSDGRFFLADNSINRYAIGDRTAGLVRAADASLDIWIGRSDPGGVRTANWLPAPKDGPFALTLRAYLPRPDLLHGSYRLPKVVPAS